MPPVSADAGEGREIIVKSNWEWPTRLLSDMIFCLKRPMSVYTVDEQNCSKQSSL